MCDTDHKPGPRTALERLRDAHHAHARAVALGDTPLLRDPAFRDLVERYKREAESKS